MSKNFSSGVNSLLGSNATKNDKKKASPKTDKTIPEANETVTASFKVNKTQLKKLRVMAAMSDDLQQKDILFEALQDYFEKYEKKHGNIPT